jgi:hypothetical protein
MQTDHYGMIRILLILIDKTDALGPFYPRLVCAVSACEPKAGISVPFKK